MKFLTNWRKLAKGGGIVFAYLLALVLFVYVTFPYGRLKSYAVTQYNATQTGSSDSRLEIDDLTWSWRFPGLVASGVRLVVPQQPEAGKDGANPPRPKFLRAQEVYVTASMMGLLLGEQSASFGAKALGGEVEGWLSNSDKLRRLNLELDGVDPGMIPQVTGAIGLPLRGQMTGLISLDIPDGKLNLAEGSIDVKVQGLEIGDGKAKIQNLMALPALNVGTFSLKAEVTSGRVKLQECAATGGQLDLSLTGGVKLRRRLEASTADLELKFRFAEKYKSKDAKTKAIFGDGKVPGLFDTVTKASLAKQDDGYYAARLSGPFNRLKPRPLKARKARASRSKNARSRAARRRAKKNSD